MEVINSDYAGYTQEFKFSKKTSDMNILISGTPQKTVYFKGEAFDKSGLTMTASLTNGVSWDVSDYHNFSSDLPWKLP